MSLQHHATALTAAVAILILSVGPTGCAAERPAAPAQVQKEPAMTAQTTHASGTFEVKLAPLALNDTGADPALGRIKFSG